MGDYLHESSKQFQDTTNIVKRKFVRAMYRMSCDLDNLSTRSCLQRGRLLRAPGYKKQIFFQKRTLLINVKSSDKTSTTSNEQESIPVGRVLPAGKPYMLQFQWPPPDVTPEEDTLSEQV